MDQKRISRQRARDRKWITSGLLKGIKYKNKLYRKYVKLTNDVKRPIYKQYRNILTKCLRKSESNYYKTLINEKKKNLYSLWEIFGPIINPNKRKKIQKYNKNRRTPSIYK